MQLQKRKVRPKRARDIINISESFVLCDPGGICIFVKYIFDDLPVITNLVLFCD